MIRIKDEVEGKTLGWEDRARGICWLGPIFHQDPPSLTVNLPKMEMEEQR